VGRLRSMRGRRQNRLVRQRRQECRPKRLEKGVIPGVSWEVSDTQVRNFVA